MTAEDIRVRVLRDGVIVVGHPRSGTSLACQLLESAGVEFITDISPDEYNQEGYYELALSKDLSRRLIKKAMTVENTRDLNRLIERMNQVSGPAGLKLVRAAAVFFYRHLARRLRVVLIYRNPADVKASMLKRGISAFSCSWFENNNALIAAYENIPESILISYESLLRGGRMVGEKFRRLGFQVDPGVIKPRARTQSGSRMLLTPGEERLYQLLQELEAVDCRKAK